MTTTAERTVPIVLKSTGPRGVHSHLEVGGVDLSSVTRDVTLRTAVDGLATADVEVIALGGFDVTLPACVTVNMVVFEGGEMVAEPLPDGTVRYLFTRKDP